MPRQRDPNRGMVVAREACVITVGASQAVYEPMTVINQRTGETVTMSSDRIVEEAREGIPYVFKQYQRAHRNHVAVKESPGSFMPIEELDDAELELVTS